MMAEILIKLFLLLTSGIVAVGVLLQFFPSIRLHATYHGIQREVYLRQEQGRVIAGARTKVLKRYQKKSAPRLVRETVVASK